MKTTTLKELLSKDNEYNIEQILIPKIQRAYAQGRSDAHATKTRKRFLNAIHDALFTGRQLTLDFIYGNVTDGCFIPLDGQQRLTTLWLLHWFAREKEKVEFTNLSLFSYDTRYSARDFLKRLVNFHPDFDRPLARQINNQGWFPMDWMNDPTVAGMLTMLDVIQQKFSDLENLWDKLDLVNFYFLSISEMNLTDEIYIKMNSRGKPLTEFEHFKAEFLKVIRSSYDSPDVGEATARRIGLKIDTEWTDLLWPYRDGSNIIDDAFMRYFLLISHILTYREGRSVTEIRDLDFFGLLKVLYKNKPESFEFLESSLDAFVKVQNEMLELNSDAGFPIDDFFAGYLSLEHENGKVVTLDHANVFMFRVCVSSYPQVGIRYTYFITLFYPFLYWILNRDLISDGEFRRRLRVIVNLLKNSSNEVVDTPKSDAGNRMPAIIRQIEGILKTGKVDTSMEIGGTPTPNFSVAQLIEESEKLVFTTENPQFASNLYQLEDHPLITGRTQIVGYANHELYGKFIRLFDMDVYERDAVDCALLAIGDYSQRKNDSTIIMTGTGNEGAIRNSAWHTLFHPTEKTSGFSRTKNVLHDLLARTSDSSACSLLKTIAEEYLEECCRRNRYDWRYYYLKYPSFRALRYGKYTMKAETPYELVALWSPQKESTNAYQCYLNEIMVSSLSPLAGEWLNVRAIEYGDGMLMCGNSSFIFYEKDSVLPLKVLPIPQYNDRIDSVDRLDYIRMHPDPGQWEEYVEDKGECAQLEFDF